MTKRKVEANEASGFDIFKGFLRGLLIGVSILSVGLVLAAIVIPRLIGAVPLTVLSGSMEPTFKPGDLIVTMPIDGNEVKRGDIVTFQPVSDDPTLITHRVLSVGFNLKNETVIITQGDANTAEDEPIIADQIMGKYIYHIPYLGWLANAIPNDNKPIIMQVLGFAFLAWAGILLISSLFKKKRKDKDALASNSNTENDEASTVTKESNEATSSLH